MAYHTFLEEQMISFAKEEILFFLLFEGAITSFLKDVSKGLYVFQLSKRIKEYIIHQATYIAYE